MEQFLTLALKIYLPLEQSPAKGKYLLNTTSHKFSQQHKGFQIPMAMLVRTVFVSWTLPEQLLVS